MTANQRLRAEVDAMKCRVKELEFANQNHEAALKAAVAAEREEIIALLLRIERKDHEHFAAYGSSGYLTGSDYANAIRARGVAHD